MMTKVIIKQDFFDRFPVKKGSCVMKIVKIFAPPNGWEHDFSTGHRIIDVHVPPEDVVQILKANNIPSKIVDGVVYPHYDPKIIVSPNRRRR